MKYLLDTNICIYLIKEKPKSVIEHFQANINTGIAISTITLAELWHGVEASANPGKNILDLNRMLSLLSILPFDDFAAIEYGKIRANLQRKGTPIGPLDMLIAAHARAMGLVLVTNNMREFERVDGLALENWVNAVI